MKTAQACGALLLLLLRARCLAIHLSDPRGQPTQEGGTIAPSDDSTQAREADPLGQPTQEGGAIAPSHNSTQAREADPLGQPAQEGGVADPPEEDEDPTLARDAAAVEARTPYKPSEGWIYHLEAARSVGWPGCKTRFVSYDNDCTKVDLFDGVGVNQQLRLIRTGAQQPLRFRVESTCGAALTYSELCSDTGVTLRVPERVRGFQQDFDFEPGEGGAFAWHLRAAGRPGCADQYIGFPDNCAVQPPDGLVLVPGVEVPGAAIAAPSFYLHVALEQQSTVGRSHRPAVDANCPDPCVWFSPLSQQYKLLCTGNDLALYTSPSLMPGNAFTYAGMAMETRAPGGGALAHGPAWLEGLDRWAPSVAIDNEDSFHSILFLSVNQPSEGNVHRVGYVVSDSEEPQSWNQYSPGVLDITRSVAGEIDQSVFIDEDSRSYLLWKTDDEWHGSAVSRLWMQEVIISDGNVSAVGSARTMLDSGGLWWATAYRPEAHTVEAPELLHHGEYYYLFFSAGYFCTDAYSEGVARSKTLWGPYEKMPVPLLSTGLVGHLEGGGMEKLRGPGHAAFVQRLRGKARLKKQSAPFRRSRTNHEKYHVVFHAHTAEDFERCAIARNLFDSADMDRELNKLRMNGRLTFVEEMVFGSDGWPYIENML